MSDLIIVAFPDEAAAFRAGQALVVLQKQYQVEMEDVVVVTRDENGEVNLNQSVKLDTGAAIGGGLWGLLIGMLFLDPPGGGVDGSGPGIMGARFNDLGLDEAFLSDVRQSLDQGGAAVGMRVRKIATQKVLEGLEPYRSTGRVIRTSLSQQAEAQLRDFLESIPPLHLPPGQMADRRK
jgi:uncharacterized membrane protein